MNVKQRNIVTYIILTICTCGLFHLFWMYSLANDVNIVTDDTGMSGTTVLLLTLVTCGIYGFIWYYNAGVKLDAKAVANGAAHDNKGLLYLLLSIFGLSIISDALMQSEINKYAISNSTTATM